MSSEEPGTELQVKPETIVLKVADMHGEMVNFRMKKSAQMRKMIISYCEKKNLDPSRLRFLFDGQRITQEDTPDKLGLSDNDVIEVVSEQTGG